MVFDFTCWFYFLLLCLDDPAEAGFTRPCSSWEGQGWGWGQEKTRGERMALKWEHLTTRKVWANGYGTNSSGRLNGFLSFSISPVNLWGLCGSTLLNIWATRSFTAEMYPESQMAGALELSGWTGRCQVTRRGREKMRRWKNLGGEGKWSCKDVCVCTVMYNNPTHISKW